MTARSLRPLAARLSAALAVGTLALLAFAAPGHADFNFTDVTTPELADTVGATDKKGVAFVDYDGDGDADICAAGDGPQAVVLLRNDGGVFHDVTSGDLILPGSGCAQTWGDFDRDGDLDLLLVFEEAPAVLFRNDGGDVFTNVTSGAIGLYAHGHSSAWVELHGDGSIDAYQANLKQPSRLYHWDGVTWVDIATDSLAVMMGDGIAWGDYDNDGDPDVYLARFNYAQSLMLRNDGDHFTNATLGPLVFAGNAQTCAWADYDNDGWLDLFVGVVNSQNRLLHNDHNGVFTLATPANVALGGHTVSPCWGDYDNDGDLDLFVTVSEDQPCHMFRNDGGGVFTDVTMGPLVGTGGNAGVANGDYDNDGDLDLYVSSLFRRPNLLLRNNLANGNHWLELSLRGTHSNTAAIGARVEIITAAGRQIREIAGNTGYRGHSDYVVHFGLGASVRVDTLRIRWPSGLRWDTTGVAANQKLPVVERQTSVGLPSPTGPSRLALATSPNPTTGRAHFTFTLPEAGEARLEILDLQGRRVATLGSGVRAAGTWTLDWSLERDRGGRVPPGIYLARLECGRDRTWRKLIVTSP
jgi:ASPIC/UnbV protein/VCBS repeat protein